MFPKVPVKTSTPVVQKVGVGLPPVPLKTVALEVRKVGVGLKIKRRIVKLTPTIQIKTGNKYTALEVQELDSYGDYQQPRKLESGASGHYCGPRTGVKNKKTTSNGIKVIVADGDTIDQIAEGKAPFNKIPTTAADVQIFPNMPNALISGGKLAKARGKIILDDPEAVVINKRTNEVVLKPWNRESKSQVGIEPPATGNSILIGIRTHIKCVT